MCENFWVGVVLLCNFFVVEYKGIGIIVESWWVCGSYGVSFVMDEGGFECGNFVEFDIEIFFIFVNDDVVFFVFDSNWCNFISKDISFLGGLWFFVGLDCIFILFFVGEFVFFYCVFGVVVYVELVIDVGKIIFDEIVFYFDMIKWR